MNCKSTLKSSKRINQCAATELSKSKIYITGFLESRYNFPPFHTFIDSILVFDLGTLHSLLFQKKHDNYELVVNYLSENICCQGASVRNKQQH